MDCENSVPSFCLLFFPLHLLAPFLFVRCNISSIDSCTSCWQTGWNNAGWLVRSKVYWNWQTRKLIAEELKCLLYSTAEVQGWPAGPEALLSLTGSLESLVFSSAPSWSAAEYGYSPVTVGWTESTCPFHNVRLRSSINARRRVFKVRKYSDVSSTSFVLEHPVCKGIADSARIQETGLF